MKDVGFSWWSVGEGSGKKNIVRFCLAVMLNFIFALPRLGLFSLKEEQKTRAF